MHVNKMKIDLNAEMIRHVNKQPSNISESAGRRQNSQQRDVPEVIGGTKATLIISEKNKQHLESKKKNSVEVSTIGLQDKDDLERIKEDSAESFLEVHNQDGVVLTIPMSNEEKAIRNSRLNSPIKNPNAAVNISQGTEVIPPSHTNQNEKLSSNNPDNSNKDSMSFIKANPSRVVLSKKQFSSNNTLITKSGFLPQAA
jgi:hypothetical protein